MRGAVAGLMLTGLSGLALTGCATEGAEAPAPTDVEVTMSCTVIARGGLSDCRVVRERPGGYGMAAEALLSAEQGRASVQPVGGRARVSSIGSRTEVSMRIPIDAAAVARFRRVNTEVSEPRS